MHPARASALLAICLSCAASIAEERPAAAPVRAPAKPVPFDPAGFVAPFQLPADCELAARGAARRNPDEGWQGLRACVDRRGYRRGSGGFTELRGVLSSSWRDQLHRNRDAPALLARIVAERGGDVAADVRSIREAGLPIYDLSDVLEDPAEFKGKVVIARGKVERTRAGSGPKALLFSEWTVRGSEPRDPYANAFRPQNRGEGRENVLKPTGRRTLVRFAGDPTLVFRDTDLILLLRFDGADPDSPPLVTVLDSFKPAAILVD